MLTIVTDSDLSAYWLPKAKQQAEIDHSDRDALLTIYLRAALEFVQDRTSRVMAPTTFLWTSEDWPDWDSRLGHTITLPVAPVRDIESIKYLDENDAEQTIAEANYTWRMTSEGVEIIFIDDYSFPVLSGRPGPVTVTFTAGYEDPSVSGSGDDPNLRIPARAELVVLMLTAWWFDHRESAATEGTKAVEMAAAAMLEQLRIWR